MSQELLLQYYRVEYEDYGRMNFLNGDDWRIQVENLERAKSLYKEVHADFTKMVQELSDGLWVDLKQLEILGNRLWFSRQYLQEFTAIVI